MHGVGAQRDRAGNRPLQMDQYCTLILLWLFSPLVDSLRGLQQAGQLEKVRTKFGGGRVALGSLSESVTIFAAEPPQEIAHGFSQALPAAGANRFDAVGQELKAVDGSAVRTVVRVAHLARLPKGKGQWPTPACPSRLRPSQSRSGATFSRHQAPTCAKRWIIARHPGPTEHPSQTGQTAGSTVAVPIPPPTQPALRRQRWVARQRGRSDGRP